MVPTASQFMLMWRPTALASRQARCTGFERSRPSPPVEAFRASVARMAIVPLQDFLGLGSDARMNTPSQSDGSWGWRFKKNAITAALADKIAALSIVCDRKPLPLGADQQSHGEVREDFAA